MKVETKQEITSLTFNEKVKLINELSHQLWSSVHKDFSKIQFEQSNNIAHQFIIDNPLGKIFYRVCSTYEKDITSEAKLKEIRIKAYQHPNNYSEQLTTITLIDQDNKTIGNFEFVNEVLRYSRLEPNVFKNKDEVEAFIKKSEEERKVRIEEDKRNQIERAKKILEESGL